MMEQSVEQKYTKQVSIEHRKKYAQFFTPQCIAEVMCKWILGTERLDYVLEPAFGLGVFSRILLKYKPNIKVKGFDVDSKIYGKAQKQFSNNKNVSLLLQDYMYNDWNNKYDAVICNPPYFKFHDYDNKGVLCEVEKRIGCILNGFTNLYTLFLLKSLYQLADSGRCAYIVPSEFMNSDYGTLVKQQLLNTGMLRYVFVFDFEENVFDDALTTSCILFCANDKHTDKVGFKQIKSLTDLSLIDKAIDSYPKVIDNVKMIQSDKLKSNSKWKTYYKEQNSTCYKHLVPFSNYAKVMRGIATGDNNYFTFNESKARMYGLDQDCLIPCVCHSIDVNGFLFSISDYEELKSKDKKILLFNASHNRNNQYVAAYIEKGERDGVNLRHLTSHRKPWYLIENRRPAPIWVSVFNRTGLRFVRNEAGIANLTTFHCVYPQTSLFNSVTIDLLFAYLISDTAKAIFEDNSREYGNGLSKFEPNDLNKGQMLDLQLLPEEEKAHIVHVYRQNKNSDDTSFIREIDGVLKKHFAYS